MKVTLKLFSGLMEYLPAGSSGNSLEVDGPGNLSPLGLVDRYGIPRQEAAVNGEFVAPENRDKPLDDGDTVSIWPSIQGG